jgi:hypothetical protein
MTDVTSRPLRALWLFALPATVAIAALTWTLTHPTETCTSGGDVYVCTHYSTMKVFVATAGVGTAVVLAALLGLALRLRRTAVAGIIVGLALIGLAVASLLRA